MSLLVLQTKKGFTILLGLILLFAFLTRIYRVSTPPTYFFDEVYHAVTSKLISRGDKAAYEWWNPAPEPDTAVDWLHPPLAKYTQAFGMRIFGENSFGWRISSVVFGVAVIAATALIAHTAFGNNKLTLLAAFLASLDGLLLAQSRIAMNDIHVTFCIILAAWSYIRYRKLTQRFTHDTGVSVKYLSLVGLLSGLAMGSKWSGIFVLVTICLFEAIHFFTSKQTLLKKPFKSIAIRFATLILLPIVIYLLSYSHMFLQGKSLVCTGSQVEQTQCYCHQDSSWWVEGLSKLAPGQRPYFESLEARGGCKRMISHFSELHNQIWWYQTTLKATHPYQSRPWQWALDLKPVWMHVDYTKNAEGVVGNVYGAGNPLLFWFGLTASLILAVELSLLIFPRIGMFILGVKPSKLQTAIPLELSFLLTLYAMVWIPWTVSPRIMFFYHYAPAVPLLCILLSYFLLRFEKRTYGKAVILATIVMIIVAFILLFPMFTGYPMPQQYVDTVFKVFPMWR